MDLKTLVSKINLKLPSPIDSIFLKSGKELMIKRDDLIHPIISGNKWRKLKFHLLEFYSSGKQSIVSMGGAYSNHLHALAYCCNALSIPCRLFVYGNHSSSLTPTLKDAQTWDAQCMSISRAKAHDLRIRPELCNDLLAPDDYWIPEGGGGNPGIKGFKSLMDELPVDFDKQQHLVLCACGTGTSISGLLKYSKHFDLKSLKVVRSARYPFIENPRFSWINDTGLKKFAWTSTHLLEYYQQFYEEYGIVLDKVYTGPLLCSFLYNQDPLDYSKILFIHSGGLQGNRILDKS